jgi:hypothetical protein
VVCGGAYLAVYATYGLNFSPGETADVSWGPIAWNLVAVAMLPAVVGGPLSWEPLTGGAFADPSDVTMLVSWAAVGALVLYAWRSRTISKRAWALVVFTTIGNVALLASARASVVGPDIAREYRYQTEAAAVVVLAIGLAFLPLRGAVEENAVREDAPEGYEDRRLIAAVTVVVVALSAVSSVRWVDLWQDRNPTEDYIENVRANLTSADEAVPLVDDGVPQTLLWSFRYPENTYSHLFAPWEAHMTFPRSAVDDLFLFDAAGDLARVRLDPARRMKLPKDADPDCPVPLEGGTLRIPLDGPVLGSWWISVDYDSPVDTHFRLVAGDEEHELDVPAGEHTAWFKAEGTFRTVEVDSFPEGTGLCITDLVLGSPEPGERAA